MTRRIRRIPRNESSAACSARRLTTPGGQWLRCGASGRSMREHFVIITASSSVSHQPPPDHAAPGGREALERRGLDWIGPRLAWPPCHCWTQRLSGQECALDESLSECCAAGNCHAYARSRSPPLVSSSALEGDAAAQRGQLVSSLHAYFRRRRDVGLLSSNVGLEWWAIYLLACTDS